MNEGQAGALELVILETVEKQAGGSFGVLEDVTGRPCKRSESKGVSKRY